MELLIKKLRSESEHVPDTDSHDPAPSKRKCTSPTLPFKREFICSKTIFPFNGGFKAEAAVLTGL